MALTEQDLVVSAAKGQQITEQNNGQVALGTSSSGSQVCCQDSATNPLEKQINSRGSSGHQITEQNNDQLTLPASKYSSQVCCQDSATSPLEKIVKTRRPSGQQMTEQNNDQLVVLTSSSGSQVSRQDSATNLLEKLVNSRGPSVVAPYPRMASLYRFFEKSCESRARAAIQHSTVPHLCYEHAISNTLRAFEVVSPEARDGHVILHLHGGAYAIGSVWFYRGFLRRLSETTKAHVISLSYRKAPENPFPAALEDAMEAWRWLLSQGYAAHSVAVLGDSAGGNLAFALSVRLAQLGEVQPAACVGFSPWLMLSPELTKCSKDSMRKTVCSTPSSPQESKPRTRLQRRSTLWNQFVTSIQGSVLWDKGVEFFSAQYCQGVNACDPLISPALASDDILKRFPPVLIHVDRDEPLCNEAEEMAARCQALGLPFEMHIFHGTMHGMQVVNTCPAEAEDSLKRVSVFLERLWEPSPHINNVGELITPPSKRFNV